MRSWVMLWSLKIFQQSLASEQISDQTMEHATCKNNSMKTNSEEKDILRNFANLNSCVDIQTQLNIWCVYTGREKFFLYEQI